MDAARLDGPKRASASAAGGVSYGPPKKGGGAAPSPVGIPSGSGGAVGKHSAARQQVKALARRQPAGPQPKLFELPPAFEAAVGRQLAFFQRVLNPAVLLEPLPPALRLSLARNFGFFTKIFTQFIDHQGQRARARGGGPAS